jgi:hypothetical protein
MIKKINQSFEDILLIIPLSTFFILWDYKIYSIVDKAVKKNVIHKNTASRKKSNIGKLYNRL